MLPFKDLWNDLNNLAGLYVPFIQAEYIIIAGVTAHFEGVLPTNCSFYVTNR